MVQVSNNLKVTHALDRAREYRKPEPQFIDAGATKLYKLEDKRADNIMACAKEWASINGIEAPGAKIYELAIPQALYDTLDRFDLTAALLAAEAFLENYGYKVERPAFTQETT